MWIGIFQMIWFLLIMVFNLFMLLLALICIPLIVCGITGARNCRRWLVVPFILFEFIYIVTVIILVVFDPVPFLIAVAVLFIL
jgi:hypothetical protein